MFWADEDEVTGFHTGFVNLFNSSKEVSFSPPVIRASSVFRGNYPTAEGAAAATIAAADHCSVVVQPQLQSVESCVCNVNHYWHVPVHVFMHIHLAVCQTVCICLTLHVKPQKIMWSRCIRFWMFA